jgi:hypothetical protein
MKALKITLLGLTLGLMSFSIPSISSIQKNETLKGITTNPLTWKNEAVEVGDIPQGIPKLIEFELKNNGTAPVIITSAKSSCGCTVADYQKEPILPGKTALVTAKYNATALGSFTKSITVTTSVDESVKVLTFKGNVIPNTKS